METDKLNFEILKSVEKALKPKGKFIMTALNALFPLYHSLKEFHKEGEVNGGASFESDTFNLMTFRDYNKLKFKDDDGNEKEIECNERYYTPNKINWLLKSLGFSKIEIFGAKLGCFSRTHPLTTEDFEMLVIAEE